MHRIGLSVTNPRQAPKIFSWTTSAGTPLPALFMTSSISVLCFFASFIGSGKLWGWLQNIVGVSNQVCKTMIFCLEEILIRSFFQIAWLSIGLSSWRFRKAWIQQGRPLADLKYRASWTWPWGPPFVVRSLYLYV